MNRMLKIELALILIVVIYYFFLVKSNFAPTIFTIYIMGLSIYFFPIKLFLKGKKNDFLSNISNFTISLCCILSYVSYTLGDIGNSLKIIFLIMMFLNLVIIYFSNNKLYYLHLILLFLIPMAFFK